MFLHSVLECAVTRSLYLFKSFYHCLILPFFRAFQPIMIYRHRSRTKKTQIIVLIPTLFIILPFFVLCHITLWYYIKVYFFDYKITMNWSYSEAILICQRSVPLWKLFMSVGIITYFSNLYFWFLASSWWQLYFENISRKNTDLSVKLMHNCILTSCYLNERRYTKNYIIG